jgi:hypothetical protein
MVGAAARTARRWRMALADSLDDVPERPMPA